MSWSYSGNPGSSAKDQVRFLIGDTISSDQLLQDAEITWLLSQYNNTPINAAIRACETIISRFSRLADESVGQVKIQFSQKAKGYQNTLEMLKIRLLSEDCAPFAGGISVVQKQAQEMNADRVRPDFNKHMMENNQLAPWTTTTEMWIWSNFQD